MKRRGVHIETNPAKNEPVSITPQGVLHRVGKRLRLRRRVERIQAFPGKVLNGWAAFCALLWQRLARAADSGPAWVAAGVWCARKLAPRHHGLAWLEALLVARRRGWATAAPRLRAIAAVPLPTDLKAACRIRARAVALLSPPQPGSACRLVVPKTPRPTRLPSETGRRIVIFTARFGQAGLPAPMFGLPEGVRCLCFTDNPKQVPGWETHVTTFTLGQLKAAPQTALAAVAPEAEFSLWLDPDRELIGNPHTLLGRWLLGEDWVMARHFMSSDWHALAERAAVGYAGGEALETLLAEAGTCAAMDLPRGRPLCDTGVIWRRHGVEEVAKLGAAWLALLAPGGTPTDDIVFHRLMEDEKTPFPSLALLPTALKTGDRETLFTAPVVRPRNPPATGSLGRKVPVTFLYADVPVASQSLILLRCRQLSMLIASRFPDLYEVDCTNDPASVRDRVVIANLTTLRQFSAGELADLRARNLALIGDWLDGTVLPEKAQSLTANLAFCHRQAIDLGRMLPELPTFHVTHNVNTDIPFITPPQDRLRTGYFGAPINTRRPESLSEVVDLVDPQDTGNTWISQLDRYNCHWVVRVDPGFTSQKGGWKPFLKGFVAARCGAPVITTRDDPQAAHYLGDDYPFYADSLAEADLELAWARVAAAFGGPDWRMAREIMRQTAERSSDEQVCLEFKTMLDTLLG